MAGRDRQIDPLTKDYIRDEFGEALTTRTAITSIYHQIVGELGQWVGDPDAGSEFFQLKRAKNPLTSPQIIRDITNRALAILVNAGDITEPDFEQVRSIDRVDSSVFTEDLQSGELLDIVDLLPFVP
jgi:hypothetical protein